MKDTFTRKKISFYLRKSHWLLFLRKRAEAGHTDNSAYIIEALGLNGKKRKK